MASKNNDNKDVSESFILPVDYRLLIALGNPLGIETADNKKGISKETIIKAYLEGLKNLIKDDPEDKIADLNKGRVYLAKTVIERLKELGADRNAINWVISTQIAATVHAMDKKYEAFSEESKKATGKAFKLNLLRVTG